MRQLTEPKKQVNFLYVQIEKSESEPSLFQKLKINKNHHYSWEPESLKYQENILLLPFYMQNNMTQLLAEQCQCFKWEGIGWVLEAALKMPHSTPEFLIREPWSQVLVLLLRMYIFCSPAFIHILRDNQKWHQCWGSYYANGRFTLNSQLVVSASSKHVCCGHQQSISMDKCALFCLSLTLSNKMKNKFLKINIMVNE